MRDLLRALIGLAMVISASVVWGAEPFSTATASKAVAEYLAKMEEIDRAATQQKAEAKSRLLEILQGSEPVATNSAARFRGMLGSYFNRDGRLPFILLSVPDGQNVLGDYARSVFNGKYDFTQPLVQFRATGHVIVPRDGVYRLEAGRGYGDFKLKGRGYLLGDSAPGNRYSAKVSLKQGEHEVEFSTNNNGGQLPESALRIIDESTGMDLPLFFYESELKAFRADFGQATELVETSKWTEEEQRMK